MPVFPFMEIRSVEAIVSALNAARVDYLIVGGLAVNAHGFVRLTRDVDLVLRLTAENAARGLQTLLAIGYQMSIPEKPEAFADEATRARWREEKQMIVLKLWSDEHRRTPIDIFVYEPFPFSEELARAMRLEISPGVSAPVVALSTLLEMKRAAGRPQDLIDIEELERMR
jgi:hypothetical protein